MIAHDPYPDQVFAEANGIRLVALDALLAEADYVTLHIGLNDATHHLIGAERLALMKPHAHLINAARAALSMKTPCLPRCKTAASVVPRWTFSKRNRPPATHSMPAERDRLTTYRRLHARGTGHSEPDLRAQHCRGAESQCTPEHVVNGL
ncbi:NAD(P)-dependent oxidoreductase [Pseudomonas sp. PCH446]